MTLVINKLLSAVLTVVMALSSFGVVPATTTLAPIQGQTLQEAGLTEATRGYGGLNTQNKSRSGEITVYVTVGSGGTTMNEDYSMSFAEMTPYIANDEVEMLARPYTFGDVDNDGDIDITDLVRTIESDKRGSVEMDITAGSMGDFFMDIFGIDADGSFTYALNGQFCNAGGPDLYACDEVLIIALTGDFNQWGATDDRAYQGHMGTKYTTMTSYLQAAGATNKYTESGKDYYSHTKGTNTPTPDPDPVVTVYNKYLTKLQNSLATGFTSTTSLSDGRCYWQEMRILNFSDATIVDKSLFNEKLALFNANYVSAKDSQYDSNKLTAVNAMRVASVTGSTKYLDILAHGFNGKSAYDYDKAAGVYAVDYILMCLDLNDYATSEAMADSLNDYATSESVRDDLIYYIVTTDGAWGGGWWTYDTGAQNAQSIVPYYNKYPEVRTRIDAYEQAAYANFMNETDPSKLDASAAAEYVRFAALMSKYTNSATYLQHAQDVYNKIETVGLENTKYKGNTMDITRMAIAEWGLNSVNATNSTPAPTPVAEKDFKLFADEYTKGSKINFHMEAEKDVTGAKLYETEIEIPSGTTITSVASTLGELDYYVQGNILRVVLVKTDGTVLAIAKNTDLFKIEAESTSNEVTLKVLTSIFRQDSETETAATVEVVTAKAISGTIAVTELYRGSDTSRFINSGLKAIKLVITSSDKMKGQLQFKSGDTNINFYETKDYSVSEGSRVYVGLVPVTVETSALENIDNYVLSRTTEETLKFGDTNHDGNINSADALWVVKLWVGKINTATSLEVLSANVDKDTDITNRDTLAIIEKCLDSNLQFKVLK